MVSGRNTVYSVFWKVRIFLEMIKFPHTVFALPFAVIAAILAADGIPSMNKLFWIIVAMIGGRSGAFGLNRLIDREIDANNPRTMCRALPRGLIQPLEIIVFIVLSFLLLLLAAYKLEPLCVKLYPIAVAIIFFYSYMKRFTWGTHLVLGLALAIAPLGAWIAITGTIDIQAVILAFVVLTWVCGFDIIYACQDIDFDKKYGIHSIPQWLGIKNALNIAALFHLFTVIFLFLLYIYSNLSFLFLIGIFVTIVLLIYEHSIVSESDLSRINIAFFHINSAVSISILFFTFLDRVLL
ncbi:MAG: UbiA-like polyprenyltransferase [Thermodesulfobacteriota bacterium]|nr:UbiA-like polyprenyltransferase [Thermodesulfobacteriota bacterium]